MQFHLERVVPSTKHRRLESRTLVVYAIIPSDASAQSSLEFLRIPRGSSSHRQGTSAGPSAHEIAALYCQLSAVSYLMVSPTTRIVRADSKQLAKKTPQPKAPHRGFWRPWSSSDARASHWSASGSAAGASALAKIWGKRRLRYAARTHSLRPIGCRRVCGKEPVAALLFAGADMALGGC